MGQVVDRCNRKGSNFDPITNGLLSGPADWTGTAYFARVLNHLTREELDGASLVVPGRTRRHVITEVGYQARALTRLTEWTASGVATPMFADPAQRLEEIADGATLPDRALRGLFHHAAVHLDVEWRDLTASQWDALVAGPDGEAICVRETAWLRARCLWLRAVDLDNGGSFLDFPPALVDRLIAESAAQWTGPSCCRNAEQVLSMNFCRPHTDSSAKTAPRRRQLVSDSKGGSTGQPNPIYRFT